LGWGGGGGGPGAGGFLGFPEARRRGYLLSELRASCWEPASCALFGHAGPGRDFFGGLLLPFVKNTKHSTLEGGAFFCVFPVGLACCCGPSPGPGPSCPGCRGCRRRRCGFGLLTAPLSALALALALALRVARLRAARRCIRHCRLPAHGTRAWPIVTRWFRRVLLHLDRTARRPCRLIPWPGLGGVLACGRELVC
jgi:hypothetical protein